MNMGDVTFTKYRYNPFRCTKLQIIGWKLGGGEHSILLKRENHVIKFEITITTKKGIIFTICIQCKLCAVALDRQNPATTYKIIYDMG